MHTIEERIQRLETSCRRWRLLTLAIAGLTVAHFAMRQPLEAQTPAMSKEIKAERLACKEIICNSIRIAQSLEGVSTSNAGISASEFGSHFWLKSGTSDFEVNLQPYDVIEEMRPKIQLSQGRDHLTLSTTNISLGREDEKGELSRKLKDAILKIDDPDAFRKWVDLDKQHNEHIHELAGMGTQRQGGGRFALTNVIGDSVVIASVDNKNSGQLLIVNADKEILHAFPPMKRK